MHAPQTMSTAGRSGLEEGEIVLALVSEPGHQRGGNSSSLWAHSGGNRTLLLPLGPEGLTCRRIPCSEFVLKSRPTFKTLTLNECCFAGQIPLTYTGAQKRTRCALGGQPGSQHHPGSEEAKRKQDRVKKRVCFSVSFLAWVPLSTRSARIRVTEDSKPQQPLPFST